ncbi:MAG: aminotransferase class I/II-fold pyridoxal phosphate-dependent enzyme [Nitrososphaerota archaeon]|nr:aminotransferase class I/II-fold pyridoxal phosphate-dependent enzyme [Candidatus Bathyarchaeota archaeon]MDW8022285.1 aminotransferase class I/II-fold pyridoxal phosphate-dependent enzyme [Nitrososphaerota archaeon]
MNIEFSNRVKRLPPYIFFEIEKILEEKKRAGQDIISLSIGDPDLPTPKFILDALREESAKPENHGYSNSRGEREFREAAAAWMMERFGVDVNPETEVTALIGSKEGIAHLSRAFLNSGDRVIIPDPGYPAYLNGAAILNEAVPVFMPLLAENHFMPDTDFIASSNAKMMFLNYPNNPTGAVVDKRFLKEIVEVARENNIIICYDNAYSEITYDGYRAPSILEVDGARDVAVELHSFSKTFSMAGDRVAFAVGNKSLVEGIVKVKSQVDSGQPKYIQYAAVRALKSYVNGEPPEEVKANVATYRNRVKFLAEKLVSIGLKCEIPKGTYYVWAYCGGNSMENAKKLLDVGVAVTPGIGFGKHGEGFLRFSATRPIKDIEEACRRLAKMQNIPP